MGKGGERKNTGEDESKESVVKEEEQVGLTQRAMDELGEGFGVVGD